MDYFFYQHYASLTFFALKLVDDQYLAEELAAEAFVKLWANRETLGIEGSIKAWLYSTVRNAAIDHLRKAKRLRVSKAGLQSAETIEQSVLHRIIAAETLQQLINHLQLLPPKCSLVFQLFYLHGKSHEEIAKELGIKQNTVRVQKVKAVQLLKAKLLSLLLLFSLLASLL